MNRIAAAVEKIRPRVEALAPEARRNFEAEMAVEFGEHHAFQNAQARAHASGKISADEARIVYVALGEVGSPSNGGWAAGTDLPTKVAVTMAVSELLI